MKPIKYKSPIIFSDREDAGENARPSSEARRDEGEAPANHDMPTVPVEPDIEDRNERMAFLKGEGFLQISVKPGSERLGEIQIEIQFEGEVGQPKTCGEEHSQHFNWAMAQLEQILAEIVDENAEFECQIAALPCPKVPLTLNLERFVKEDITVPISVPVEIKRNLQG